MAIAMETEWEQKGMIAYGGSGEKKLVDSIVGVIFVFHNKSFR